ncbi:hypothetical protein C9374_012021 [Naegleria lovaniensis]|uniref:Carotenoid oxygenase n=1 Tax=Naegleria lovaniensis TaxID=51637 RepID=A0AA88GEU2_NAELO|nr:uncharacterized protein C9374_012021 [Naegleria lovaniensis]KAG2373558.1 hypothetical protein C9374_012021 [Naegleria lovaniensis]
MSASAIHTSWPSHSTDQHTTKSTPNTQFSQPPKSYFQKLFILALVLIRIIHGLFLWSCQTIQLLLFPNYKNRSFEFGIKKNPVMNGNFAPIHDELHCRNLFVLKGEIPRELNGMYVRIGPNPQFDPLYSIHWFEGDGHLHAIEFKDGQASYRNKFVQTEKYLQEKEQGRPLSYSFFVNGINPILKYAHHYLYDRLYRGLKEPLKTGGGVANTNIIYHGGKFLALEEGHRPVEISLPNLETIGEFTFETLNHNFTAHPKYDPESGELMFFAYGMNPRGPSLWYGVIDKNNKIVIDYEFKKEETPYTCMIHDMAITEHYSIIGFYPAIIDLNRIFHPSLPLVFDKSKPVKFAVFPRHFNGHNANIQWFEAKSCMAFHYINAFESQVNEDETLITIDVCTADNFDLEDFSSGEPYPSRFVLNLKRGELHEEGPFKFTNHLQEENSNETMVQENIIPSGEFPVIYPNFTGKPYRYFFYSIIEEVKSELFVSSEFAKFDLHTRTLKRLKIPEHGKIGEVCLIPKIQKQQNTLNEDDVFVVTFAYHEEKQTSSLFIFDGTTMNEEPLCQLELPRRVPFGFHGQFFPSSTF